MTDVDMVPAEFADNQVKLSHPNQAEEDLYMKMKELESELEILQIQEDYLKDEQRHLQSEYIRSKEEVSFFTYINQILFISFRSREFSQFRWLLVALLR